MTKAMAATLEQMKPFLDQMVEQKLIELLGDPDSSLKLSPEIKARLRKGYKLKELRSAESVAAGLGLKW